MLVVIYTKRYCPYCVRAKSFFESHSVAYKEIDITNDHEKLNQLKAETNFMTLPQIFIDGRFIGGYTDMIEQVDRGELKF